MPLLKVFCQGLVLVTLTAWNVRMVAAGSYPSAFVVGGLLSFVWFTNAKAAAHSDSKWARWAYALGAACGTVAGMLLGSLMQMIK